MKGLDETELLALSRAVAGANLDPTMVNRDPTLVAAALRLIARGLTIEVEYEGEAETFVTGIPTPMGRILLAALRGAA